MTARGRRTGMSLIELMATIIIAATIAALSIQYLRPTSDTGKQRSCDMIRETLQSYARYYNETTGQVPSGDLSELQSPQSYGAALPKCPVTGESYSLDRSGVVTCPTHEATRDK